MAEVAALWRHPIKSHGRESVERADLKAGGTFPGDRIWAIRHAACRIDPQAPVWGVKANFMTGVRHPVLAAIRSRLDDGSGIVDLSHPATGAIRVNPDLPADQARLVAWLAPLTEGAGPQPEGVIRLPGRGMTDSDWPSVSLINLASHAEVARHLGQDLAAERWRCNIWTTGLAPWAERDLVGRRLRIGVAELLVREHIGRCMHTAANPDTGLRDADTLGALRALTGEQDFGIFCEVTRGGAIRPGDRIEVL